jgi:hypothetical protein
MRPSHLANPLLRFRLPGVLLAIVILIGITGYQIIDGWDLLDSFYMTIITISTVGYTEVHPQSRSRQQDRLAKHQPPGRVEVLRHPLRVDR